MPLMLDAAHERAAIAAREAMEAHYAPTIAALEEEARDAGEEIRESGRATADELSITINTTD